MEETSNVTLQIWHIQNIFFITKVFVKFWVKFISWGYSNLINCIIWLLEVYILKEPFQKTIKISTIIYNDNLFPVCPHLFVNFTTDKSLFPRNNYSVLRFITHQSVSVTSFKTSEVSWLYMQEFTVEVSSVAKNEHSVFFLLFLLVPWNFSSTNTISARINFIQGNNVQ